MPTNDDDSCASMGVELQSYTRHPDNVTLENDQNTELLMPMVERTASNQKLQNPVPAPVAEGKQTYSSSLSEVGDQIRNRNHPPPRPFAFLDDNKQTPKRIRRQRWAIVGLFWVGSILITWIGLFISLRQIYKNWYPVHSKACDLDSSNGVQLAFQIDLRAISNLSFGTAKAISVAFDFVLGQMGRILLGWVAWRVLNDALTTMMEHSLVPYDLYKSITLSTTSYKSMWEYTKSISQLRERSNRWILGLFIYITLWTLLWPTIISASMGYVSGSIGHVYLTDGSLIDPATAHTQNCYNIPNGPQIGLSNNATLRTTIDDGCALPVDEWYTKMCSTNNTNGYSNIDPRDDTLLPTPEFEDFRESYYASNGNHTNITGPLNPIYFREDLGGQVQELTLLSFYVNSSEVSAATPLLEIDVRRCFNGIQVRDWRPNMRGSIPSSIWNCVQVDGYQWGFSSTMCTFAGIGMLIWVAGIFYLFLRSNRHSTLIGNGGTRRGLYRTVVDMSEALREELGPNVCSYTDEELGELLKDKKLGYYTDQRDVDIGHFGASSQRLGRVELRKGMLYGRCE